MRNDRHWIAGSRRISERFSSMRNDISIELLTAETFAPFGQVIQVSGNSSTIINQGNCHRYNDLAEIEVLEGAVGISLFDAKPYSLPLVLDLLERHPLGSQAFLPMSNNPFLVIAAQDHNGLPGRPCAWITNGAQGVNYTRNIWHGVLTPLQHPARFAVVDRISSDDNLEEVNLNPAYRLVDTTGLLTQAKTT